MRLLGDIFTGPNRPGSVSGLQWSTLTQRRGPGQHAGWTKSRGPVRYVGGNPLNRTDPTGLIPYESLSSDQRQQLIGECSQWAQPGLCLATAFCSDPIDCATVGRYALSAAAVSKGELDYLTANDCANSFFHPLTSAMEKQLRRGLKEDMAAANVAFQQVGLDFMSHSPRDAIERAKEGEQDFAAGAANDFASSGDPLCAAEAVSAGGLYGVTWFMSGFVSTFIP